MLCVRGLLFFSSVCVCVWRSLYVSRSRFIVFLLCCSNSLCSVVVLIPLCVSCVCVCLSSASFDVFCCVLFIVLRCCPSLGITFN